ncbi:MAG TPA: hypothetical protein VKA48_05620 [Gammaproteobacteria bacterium]|nr:hypothetical protein [Gammaproteobacteria bacterium]
MLFWVLVMLVAGLVVGSAIGVFMHGPLDGLGGLDIFGSGSGTGGG